MRSIAQILCFFQIFFMVSLCHSQPNQAAPLKQCLIDRVEAISKQDTGVLNKICDSDYRLISSSGSTYDLKELKKTILDSKSQLNLSTIVSYQPFITADETMAFAVCEIEEVVGRKSALSRDDRLWKRSAIVFFPLS